MSDDANLPDGWRLVMTGDVAEVVGGGTPKTSVPGVFTEDGGHPWVTPADLKGYSDKYIARGRRNLSDEGLAMSSAKYMPAGTVLYSTRAPIGYVAIAANPVTTNQGFRSFVPSSDVDSEYLYYGLKLARAEAEELASGTTFAELSGSNAKKLHLPLAPLGTQKQIVRLLDAANASSASARHHLTSAQRAVERFRQALLTAACIGLLTADWRDTHQSESGKIIVDNLIEERRRKLGRRFKDDLPALSDEMPVIPESWSWASPGSLCDPTRVITYGVIKLGPQVDGGVPVLRSSDVRWLRIDSSGVKRVASDIADSYKRTYLRGGEVLVTVRGTLGGVAVVPPEMVGWNVSREVAVIPFSSEIDASYCMICIGSAHSQRWLNGVARGVAYTGVNIEDLRKLPLAIPPIAEQREIVARVEALLERADRLTSAISAASLRVNHTAPSILAKAFRGGLSRS